MYELRRDVRVIVLRHQVSLLTVPGTSPAPVVDELVTFDDTSITMDDTGPTMDDLT